MQRILLIVTILICSFLNVGQVKAAEIKAEKVEQGFSYADGWLDRNVGKYTVTPSLAAAVDNDLSTAASLRGKEYGHDILINENIEVDYLAFYIDSHNSSSFDNLTITFYKKNVKVHSENFRDLVNKKYINIEPPVSFDKINLQHSGTVSSTIIKIYEFELFDKDSMPMPEFKEIKAEYDYADIEVKMPAGAKSLSVYLDGKHVANTTNGKYTFGKLKSDTTYKVSVVATFDNAVSRQVEATFKTKRIPEIEKELIKVSAITHNSATVNFLISKVLVVPKTIILNNNGNEVSRINVLNNQDTYTILRNLKNETNYKYEVEFIYADDTVRKVEFTFETNAAQKEVKNLSAIATDKDVNLNWQMPVYDDLEIARIYRQKEDASMFSRVFMNSSTYDPLFETNGTTFKDLTVEADTEYTYKVTTVDTSDNETSGKTVKIRTKKTTVSGGGTNKDENGDYVITWTSPVTGKIKVLVGGKEYAIVPAADKKIVIPKDKMEFDLIGNPDVKLIPIDDDGNEGTPSKPGGGGTGGGGGIGDIVGGGAVADVLGPDNVLKAGVQLLMVIGGFVLLALAFRVVPKLVRTIRMAFSRTDIHVEKRRVQD